MEKDEKEDRQSDLSCTFCGPGTWALWDVIAEDGVFFVCDRHHVEMSEANIITLERRIGKTPWKEVNGEKGAASEEEDLEVIDSKYEHERRDTY
jgi:hypothetical protein